MANNLVSRFFGGQSIYESLQQQDDQRDIFFENDDDVEPLMQRHHTIPGLGQDTSSSSRPGPSQTSPPSSGQPSSPFSGNPGLRLGGGVARGDHSNGMSGNPSKSVLEHDDDAPPASLLIEGIPQDASRVSNEANAVRQPLLRPEDTGHHPPGLEGFPPPPSSMFEPPWNPAAETDGPRDQDHRMRPAIPKKAQMGTIDPHQRAMYKWANVEDVDSFLRQVYEYYLGKGIYCICLTRLISLLTIGFIVGFTSYMFLCINYSIIREKSTTRFEQIRVKKCMTQISLTATLVLWLFSVMWIMKLILYIIDIRRLYDIHQFYHYLLEIPDMDIQTVSWQDVVQKLMSLRDANPVTSLAATRKYVSNYTSKQRMDAVDIANRLMRKENYLIALFNKDILDLSIPLPFLRHRWLLTRNMEWNLSLSILDFVFHDGHNFNPMFLKESARKELSKALRTRFFFFGIMNLLLAPFSFCYFVIKYFLEYFIEYRKNPSALGSREYTPLAEWKFREFNELVHMFQRRMNLSYPFAQRYLDQFPKEKTVQVARFVSFVTGAFAAVLAIASLLEPEKFLGFEITQDRTVLFYIGVFTAISTVARGTIPGEAEVFDPAAELSWVIYHTRYNPPEWRDRLHSDEVRGEFSKLYEMKIVNFLWEVSSIILTPFVLCFSLPKCSDRIIDFFREFTVHVDGIGYVCSFAEFDFNLTGAGKMNAAGAREDYFETAKDPKMMSSIVGFLQNYGPRSGNAASHRDATANTHGHLLSPTNAADGHSVLHQRRRAPTYGSHSQQFGVHSGHRGHTSTLLDRHHQPNVPHARTLRQSVYQYSAPNNRDDLLREEDEEGDEGMDGHYVSNLGESFMSTRLEDDHQQPDAPPDPAGGGVMELLKQFQRHQFQSQQERGV